MNDVEQLLQLPPKAIMRSIIQRIATGPDMSKAISQQEARAGMRAVLNNEIDPVQAAVFLIALRMKRETDAENRGILDAIRDVSTSLTAPVDEVLDLSDPYNGCNRSLPAAPFLPAVMAACGVATISHGVETMSPKFGITHHRVLRAAGLPVNLPVEDAAERLGDARIGWAYVDQATYSPQLHDLARLRAGIIKRQAISTVEVLTGPVRGRSKTHFMSGYVHAPYARVYAMLARHSGFDSCLLVRGVEGGLIPSLRQKGKVYFYHGGDLEQAQEFDPAEIGINQDVRATPLPEDLPARPANNTDGGDDVGTDFDVELAAKRAAEAGIAALNGTPGSSYDGLVYAGAIALWHLHRYDRLPDAANRVREALESGEALQRLQAARA